MVNVTKISDYEATETIVALKDLLVRAQDGRLRGFAFVIKIAPRTHRVGFTGDYWNDPVELLGPVTRMEYKVNQLISSRDGDPETSTMPL